MEAKDIQCINAEAGVIATLLLKPEYIWYSEQLNPHHFYSEEHAAYYYAIKELVENKGVMTIDAYNLTNILKSRRMTSHYADILSIKSINETIDIAPTIARLTPDDYRLSVEQVIDTSFRRDAFRKLRECEELCAKQDDNEKIQTKIYNEIEDLICSYQNLDSVAPLGEKIDKLWEEIKKGQESDSFVEFKFPSLNEYVKISRTDAIILAAREKRGKSLFLMNCAVDLLKKGKRVLVIDTELDSKLYVMRLFSHLAKVDFVKIRDGTYTPEEEKRVEEAREWLKGKNFAHEYMPEVDGDKIISLTKKYMHTYGLDCLILDYLKGNTAYYLDAYQNSATLGKITDILKNKIAGEMKLFVLTAVQATSTGAIADSAKIIRNCSTLMYLERKTPELIEADGGEEFGNMTLNVRANRNGMIMGDDEYISLTLDGNKCTFTESKQPKREEPF